ncbi:hypothetical protein MHB50_20635 [Siminovitchia sp. FSL H7-0308]|uniref:hypothetical protein n=1 Tax=Siminovitchia sp. FSL H7-0308 TaxID=2921432 RepID=UPI0030EE591F
MKKSDFSLLNEATANGYPSAEDIQDIFHSLIHQKDPHIAITPKSTFPVMPDITRDYPL